MRKVMQIFRIRKIGSLPLVLLALVAIFPVFFFSYRITDGAEGIK